MSAVTLYALEENLVALLDTVDMVEDPAQQEAIARDIVAAHLAAVEKRDKVAQFIAHCEIQQAGIDAEIKRLQNLKQTYSKTQERVEGYVTRTILDLGKDEKGKYRKLEGKTAVFSVKSCPASVDIKDDAVVPSSLKTLALTVPAEAWQEFVDSADIDERSKFMASIKKCDIAVDKRAVKAALESGDAIPGVALVTDKYSLQRR